MILKPPFLTEREAIFDYLKSLIYLDNLNLSRIDMEIPTIEKDTLLHTLWEKKLYHPPKLWSVIKIIKLKHRLGLKTPLYLSPQNYSVPSEYKSSNCEICTNLIIEAFEEYNQYRDPTVFNKIKCSCEESYAIMLKKREKAPKISLNERVEKTITSLN